MTGGIQLLLDRLVRHSSFSYEVVTVRMPSDLVQSAGPEVVRSRRRLMGQRSSVGILNGRAVIRGLVSRPVAVLSGHVATGPAALALQATLGVPAIQYLYCKELDGRPNLSRVVVRRVRTSIAISSHTRLKALALGAAPDHVHVIQCGVDLPADSRARIVVREQEPPIIVTVARLEDRYKGFDVMIRALPLIRRRIPGVHWVVVGDGSLRGELEEMVRAQGVRECVTFTGRVDDEARDEWLDRAQVFAMPSRLLRDGSGGEGFGIVYLEAGAHGVPCVAGNVGGSVDAVVDGETGLLVDPTDHVAVADAIAELLLDFDLRRRLGEAGRDRAEELSWARMAEQVDILIERVVAGAKR